ncbi:MAG TPA: response regulator [Candidatus Saccharimonadales bacterium]|jgi:two-component system chemotaxis sensor kinase CheA|nr:response regulator [Candidatus Saccharimonadales bacterium]
MAESKDRYKYFRIESRELLEGLSQGMLELEKGSPGKDLIGRILRLAHTLKGAARVVQQPEIADLSHAIEDIFAPYRDQMDAVSPEQVNQALGMLDTIAARVASLDLPATAATGESPPQMVEEFFETVRVEIAETDKLLDGISEAAVQLTALRREAGFIERTRQLAGSLRECLALREGAGGNATGWMAAVKARTLAEELCSHLEHLERNVTARSNQVAAEFAQVRDAANRLRLLPAKTVFASLERAARDAARTLRKEVLFESFGGEIRLDTHVLAALRDALLHVVRNAVAHGTETPAQRTATGKPAQGRIELRVERRSQRVAFICRDDGRGIDVEAVRRVAVRRNLTSVSDAASLKMEEVVRIIMKGGVSTAERVDEVSGRGIGLDVVRETAVRLKGEVTIRSEPGRGTLVEICVPVMLSSLAALEVDAAGAIVAVPLDAVREIKLVADREIACSATKESMVYNGKVIPFLNLAAVLRRELVVDRKRHFWTAVVLEASNGTAAIGVERLIGVSNIIVKPLPALAVAEPVVLGASLDVEGNPQLVLDPKELIAAAGKEIARANNPSSAQRSVILVVDDSLTTRMLEQNILESAGYEVDLATSGEEGLAKARQRQYNLFLVDVEMPGIDGFEFVSRTQSDAVLRTVPSVLVTSRDAPEDRRRGEQMGARGYIVKGEFDQGHLLRKICELTG